MGWEAYIERGRWGVSRIDQAQQTPPVQGGRDPPVGPESATPQLFMLLYCRRFMTAPTSCNQDATNIAPPLRTGQLQPYHQQQQQQQQFQQQFQQQEEQRYFHEQQRLQ